MRITWFFAYNGYFGYCYINIDNYSSDDCDLNHITCTKEKFHYRTRIPDKMGCDTLFMTLNKENYVYSIRPPKVIKHIDFTFI